MKKRVKLPKDNPKALLDLAAKLRVKHRADGETSPLKVLNWAEIDFLIDDSIAVDDRAMRLKREKLLTFQLRNQRLKQLMNFVRNSRDILTGVHSDEMKTLGLWGYDVLESRSSARVVPAPERMNAE